MSKCTIREFMGDYALDIEPFDGHKITLYFNSRRNAETVKRCIELRTTIFAVLAKGESHERDFIQRQAHR